VSPSPDPVDDDETRASRTILRGETPNAAAIPTGCRFHPRCPLAFDRCLVEEPPLFDIGSGQRAACWLAEGGRELPAFPTRASSSPTADPTL
jgi:oligopeptide/dipeptide ABC transporter ATP-binding protein